MGAWPPDYTNPDPHAPVEVAIRSIFIRYAGRFVNANRYQQNRVRADAIADDAVHEILKVLTK